VNLRELGIATVILTPFVAAGAVLGFHESGVAGALMGTAKGLLYCYGACTVIILAVAVPSALFDEWRWRRVLRPHFGKFWKSHEAWARVKAERRVFDAISGKVVAVLGDEALIDVGAGFPASLREFRLDGAKLPNVGESVSGWIYLVDDDRYTIDLTLRPPRPKAS
jgi:hypothetical protein